MKDAFTGADINIPADAGTRQKVFLSEALARLFGKTDVTGQKYILMIRAVMKLQVSFKIISTAIMNNLILYWCGYIMRYKEDLYELEVQHHFSLKEGVDANAFEQRFKRK